MLWLCLGESIIICFNTKQVHIFIPFLTLYPSQPPLTCSAVHICFTFFVHCLFGIIHPVITLENGYDILRQSFNIKVTKDLLFILKHGRKTGKQKQNKKDNK